MPRSIENLRAIRPPPTTLAHTSDHGRSWVAGSGWISYLFRTGRSVTRAGDDRHGRADRGRVPGDPARLGAVRDLRPVPDPAVPEYLTSDARMTLVDLEAFELVLLRTPETAPAYDDAELERIQAEHLAHHARLRESGQVVTNGPVRDQPDASLRGLMFYRIGSLEQARQLAEADPAVRAGRLAVEIMTWYCPPGTMSKPGRAVTL